MEHTALTKVEWRDGSITWVLFPIPTSHKGLKVTNKQAMEVMKWGKWEKEEKWENGILMVVHKLKEEL